MSDRQERIWRCDSGHDHFLAVVRYPGDPEGCISLIDATNCRSLRCRLRAAWNVVRYGSGNGHYGIEVVLSRVTARELIEELQAQWPAKPE